MKKLAWLEISDDVVVKELIEWIVGGADLDDEEPLLELWSFPDRATAERVALKALGQLPLYEGLNVAFEEDGQTKEQFVTNADYGKNCELWGARLHPKQLAEGAA